MSKDQTEQSNLIRLAVEGQDMTALARLLVGAHDRLLRYIRRRMPIDLERVIDAEDVLSESFTLAFQQIHSLRGESEAEFVGWLTTIAQNRMRNIAKAHRAQKRGGGQSPITGPAFSGADVDGDGAAADILEMLSRNSKSPRSVAGNREYLTLIREAIGQLGSEHQAVLQLRFVENLPHAQIARQIGRSEGAVRQLCLRAVRQLRALLPFSSVQ